MADLLDTLRGGVALARGILVANRITASVTWTPWRGQDGLGDDIPGTPRIVQAIVEKKKQVVKDPQGLEIATSAYIGILEPLSPVGVVVPGQIRNEPIDERDVFTLPDGTTGPIVFINGFVDGGTGRPMFHEVYLG